MRLNSLSSRLRLCWPAALLALLTACGGGGGGGGGGSDSSSGSGSAGSSTSGSGSTVSQTPGLPSNNAAFATCPTTPAAGTGSAPANAGDPGVISGRITFDRVPFFPATTSPYSVSGPGLDYDSPELLPVRGAVVEAVAPTSAGVCSGTVVDTTLTDGDGWYALNVDPAATVCVRVRAQLFHSGSPAWNFSVADNTDGNSLYVLAGDVFATSAAQPTRNLHAALGWSGGAYTAARSAAPFAILDTVCKAMNTVLNAEPAAQFGSLTLLWSTLNTDEDGDISQGKIGGAFFSPINRQIYLRGDALVNTDEFDEMVIAHEFGHFVVNNFSRSDSLGGEHNLFNIIDPRVAFDEGWATAFAGLVLHSPIYRDSDEVTTVTNSGREFSFNMQALVIGMPRGWYAETSMQRSLYNMGADVADGGLGMGVGTLLQSFAGSYASEPALATIFSYASWLKTDNPGWAGSIAATLDAESIDGDSIEPFAGAETHAPTSSASDLPVYRDLGVVGQGGAALTVCSTNANGLNNKLSNRRYLRFTPPNSGRYRFTAQPASAYPDGQPGMELFDRGAALFQRQVTAAGTTLSVSTSTALSAGQSYVLGVYHVGNVDVDSSGSSATAGDKCFQVWAEVAP